MSRPWLWNVLVWMGVVLCGHAGAEDIVLPDHFDLRNVNGTNCVSPVQYQYFNICWTFSACASMESSALLSGLGEYDLSEWHMANYGQIHVPGGSEYTSPYDGWSGRSWQAEYYLTAGLSPVLESVCGLPLPSGRQEKPS